jgi:hypothetical protein
MRSKPDISFRPSDRLKDTGVFCFLAVFVVWRFRIFLLPGDLFYWVGDFIELAPQRAYFYQHLRQGSLILWDAFVGTGMPYLAEDFGVFYPIDLLIGMLTPDFFNPYLLSWVHALHFWLGGVFAYLYVRQLGLWRIPALVSSLCFIAGGFLVGRAGIRNGVATIIWLPLVLYFLDKALLRRRALWAALGGAGLAFSFLSGHPNLFYFNLLYIAAYFLFLFSRRLWLRDWPGLVRETGYFGVLGIFCLGLSAIELWPLIATSLSTYHGTRPYDWNVQFPFTPLNLVHFLIPGYTDWVAKAVDEEYGYIGLFPFLLALWAVFRCRDRRVIFFGLLALVALVASLGDATPLYRFLYDVLPGLNQFRIPAKFISLVTFPLAVLAGFGAQYFLEAPAGGDRRTSLRSLYWVLGLALAGGLASLVLVGVSLSGQETGGKFWGIRGVLIPNFIWFLLLWSGAFLLVTLRNRERFLNGVKIGLIVLVGLDLQLLAWVEGGYVRTDPTLAAPLEQRIVAQLKKDQSLFRVSNIDRYLPSLRCYQEGIYPYDLANLLGYIHQVVPREYLGLLFRVDQNPRLLDLMNVKYFIGARPHPLEQSLVIKIGERNRERDLEFPAPTTVSKLKVQSLLTHSTAFLQGQTVARIDLENLNGRTTRIPIRAGIETAEWAIDRPGLKTSHQKARVASSWDIAGEGYQGHFYEFTIRLPEVTRAAKIIFRYMAGSGTMAIKKVEINDQDLEGLLYARFQPLAPDVYYNPTFFPRVFMIARAEAVPQEEELLEKLEYLDPRKTLLLEKLPPDYREPAEPSFSAREAQVLHYSAHSVKISTRADQNKFLVLGDTYSSFWQATIDNRPAAVLKADYGLRGLYVPRGEHQVEFVFRFYPFYFGLAVTIFSLLALLFWAIVHCRRRTGPEGRC